MFEVIMPKLGLTMESGVIEKWHKKEGDKIEVGDVLFEVATDKVSLEVESYNLDSIIFACWYKNDAFLFSSLV